MAAGHNKNEPSARLAALEKWSAHATLLILVGILLEIAVLFIFSHGISWSEKRLLILADALIGAGLIIEYVCIIRTIVASAELQRTSDERVAAAEARAAEANQKAQEAILELAELRAPRGLAPEQRGRIVDKLKPFSGIEYDIAISDSNPEILNFVFIIELVLSTAGWVELDWQGKGDALIREGMPFVRLRASVANVIVGVHVSQPLKLWECASALADALTAEGIDATAGRHTPHEMSSTNANAVHILIGPKL